MRVILPMAGFGTRLRPLTWSKPKPLVPVAGKPVLGHVMDLIAGLPRLNEAVFIVGFLGEQVQAYIRKEYPALQGVYIEQKELLGQSHALWQAREYLEGPVLILFVDTLIETDFDRVMASQSEAVAWVKRVDDPRRFGVAELGPDGLVKRLVEKPTDTANRLAVVGCYFLPEGALLRDAIERQMKQNIQLGGEYFLVDAINLMLQEGLRMRVEQVETWEDCGKPEALLHANRYLLEHGRDNSPLARTADSVVIPPVYIDPGAEVVRSLIGPYVSLAAGCCVENSILQNCVVDEEAAISNMVISESLVGRQARLTGKSGSVVVGDSSEMRQV
jgi:glucose-1-phosphate thymidylyltransferase